MIEFVAARPEAKIAALAEIRKKLKLRDTLYNLTEGDSELSSLNSGDSPLEGATGRVTRADVFEASAMTAGRFNSIQMAKLRRKQQNDANLF
jgi:hypothetical protein